MGKIIKYLKFSTPGIDVSRFGSVKGRKLYSDIHNTIEISGRLRPAAIFIREQFKLKI